MTSDLRPVDMHTTIPDALRREIDDDLAAGGERARKWLPRATLGVTRILALDGPHVGRVGTPTGIAGWTYDDGNFGRIFVSADGGSPWRYGLDNRPPQHPVTARAYIGTVDRTPGMDLQAANPRPVPGDRILVPDTPGHFPQTVGQVATVLDAGDHPHANRWLPATLTGAPGDVFFVGAWALLPQSDAPTRQAKERRDMHPEIEAMAAIVDALDGLDDDAIGRVLRWANDRYTATPAAGPSTDDVAHALEAMDAEAAWLKEQADKSGEQDHLVRALTAESMVSTARRALAGDPTRDEV